MHFFAHLFRKRSDSKPPLDGKGQGMRVTCYTLRAAQTSKNNINMEDLEKICTKTMLTSDEAALYMGISKSTLYKWSMSRRVPHFKPSGKLLFFNRLELEDWLQRNRVSTDDEISQQAQTYCVKKGGSR